MEDSKSGTVLGDDEAHRGQEGGFCWEAEVKVTGDKEVKVPDGLSTWVFKTVRTSIRA